jgi:hypothetical protein
VGDAGSGQRGCKVTTAERMVHLALSQKAATTLRSELQVALDEEEYVVANRSIIEAIIGDLNDQIEDKPKKKGVKKRGK